MATCTDEFEDWLCTKLKALNTDQDVFGAYIRGILEGEEGEDEKLAALDDILVEIVVDDTVTVDLRHEILDRWDKYCAGNKDVPRKLDMGDQLASIMEKQAQTVMTERKLNDEERKYKEAILAQYSHVSESEESDGDEHNVKDASATGMVKDTPQSLIPKNTNSEDVLKAEKDKRDKARSEMEKKKAVDKANKEKQKQQQQERKEKEKKRTQKGERKR